MTDYINGLPQLPLHIPHISNEGVHDDGPAVNYAIELSRIGFEGWVPCPICCRDTGLAVHKAKITISRTQKIRTDISRRT